jgi:quercetin dioxygenase-like cupin family protein
VVYWHLRAFPSRAAAKAAKSRMGLVFNEEGRVWLSEFGPREAIPGAGEVVAVVGPLQLPRAERFNAVLSFAIMRPGDRSMIHTHPGPEGWYLLAGEQCVLTPSGSKYAAAGETMTTPPNVPIELRVTGRTTRRALLVVIHDAAKPRTIPSMWEPPARCGD